MNDLILLLRRIRHGRSKGAAWWQMRYYPRWKRSLEPGASSMRDRQPWLTFPAIDLLHRHARPAHRVFEYGGGGSTLFWCDRVAEVITVEHDAAWFKALEQAVHGVKAQWRGLSIPSDAGDLVPEPDAAEPTHYSSADEASKGRNYKAYAQAISAHPDASFDIILIDGRARASCLALSVPKLKPGGLLVLDNAERAYYTERNSEALRALEPILSGMAPLPYDRDLSETRIYRKRA